jgi:Lipopolysaccharide assembly protein A domain
MFMGIVLILLALVTAGVTVDFLIENDLGQAPAQSFEMFGRGFELSGPAQVLVAFGLGALTVALLVLGFRLMRDRRERRRRMEKRVAELEAENTRLASRANLEAIVRIPDASATTEGEEEPAAEPSAPEPSQEPAQEPSQTWSS